MQTRIIRIGNSRGVRLSRAVIEEAGLKDVVDVAVRKGVVILRPGTAVRSGWAEDAQSCHEQGDDGLILGELSNAFDREW